jgi:hypothetical protein
MKVFTNKSSFYFLLIALALCIGCTYDTIIRDPYDITEIRNCHDLTQWTPDNTRDSLIGSWSFEYSGCVFTSATEIKDEIQVSITADSIFVEENNSITDQSAWTLHHTPDSLFRIETDPYIDIMEGTVFLCGNMLLTYEEHVTDACQFLFQKK